MQQATAQYEHWDVENQEEVDEQHATLSATCHSQEGLPTEEVALHILNGPTKLILRQCSHTTMLTGAKTTHNWDEDTLF